MNPDAVAALNAGDDDFVTEQFRKCCGADAWIDAMLLQRPFADPQAVHEAADVCFAEMTAADWQQAFNCHPRIGDVNSMRMKFAGNDRWSRGEQAGVDAAAEATLQALADGNRAYFDKFGYIFIVCATGKSAAEMLAILQSRLPNDPVVELPLAAAEQRKITHLRIDKLELSQ